MPSHVAAGGAGDGAGNGGDGVAAMSMKLDARDDEDAMTDTTWNLFGENLAPLPPPTPEVVAARSVEECTEDPEPEDYERGLRAVWHHEHSQTINQFLLELNGGLWQQQSTPVLAKLVREGILKLEGDRDYRIMQPPPDEDWYAKALDWFNSACLDHKLDTHWLKYRANVYREEDRQAVIKRMQVEGYIDKNLRILKRPKGAQRWDLPENKWIEASLKVVFEPKQWHCGYLEGVQEGWMVYADFGLKSESYGVYGPVWNGEHGKGWDTKESAILAGCRELARRAEQAALEAELKAEYLQPMKKQTVHMLPMMRLWVDGLPAGKIPRQLSTEEEDSRRSFYAGRAAEGCFVKGKDPVSVVPAKDEEWEDDADEEEQPDLFSECAL